MRENKINRPLLSIVIANYNYGRFLDEAIQSVLNQSCQDFELIVCDAASNDNSVEIITKYAHGLPPNAQLTDSNQPLTSKISWWCSEKDGGQSAAFNKGFARARGRFLTWLNADDVFLPGVVASLKKVVEQEPDCEWFVGGSLWLDPQMRVLHCHPCREFSQLRYKYGHVSVWGPSSFFSKRILLAAGGVDERFHYKMDTDLWLKFAKMGYRYRPFKEYAFGLRLHPDGKMSGHEFAESELANPDHPKWKQLRRENEWIEEVVSVRKMGPLSRFTTMGIWPVMRGLIDDFRFRGKTYKDLFI